MKQLPAIMIITAILATTVWSDSPTDVKDELKSARAKEAIGLYERRVRLANNEFTRSIRPLVRKRDGKVEEARQSLVKTLEQAKSYEAEADRLDEAVKIRELIEQLQATEQPTYFNTMQEVNESLAGSQWTFGIGDYRHPVVLREDHQLVSERNGGRGVWAAISNNRVIVQRWEPHSAVFHFEFDGGKGRIIQIDAEEGDTPWFAVKRNAD